MKPVLLALVLAAAPPFVPKLDLARYAGTWHEVARLPTFFERGCVGVTATYVPEPNGRIAVINRCVKDGKVSEIRGEAWVPDPAEPAKLKVQFFWPFKGDYWVLDVAPDYSWALVGDPGRSHAWILSRAPTLDDATYARLVARLRELGFDSAALEKVPPS
jgi:apolipoprotein D and lipocalin family protein